MQQSGNVFQRGFEWVQLTTRKFVFYYPELSEGFLVPTKKMKHSIKSWDSPTSKLTARWPRTRELGGSETKWDSEIGRKDPKLFRKVNVRKSRDRGILVKTGQEERWWNVAKLPNLHGLHPRAGIHPLRPHILLAMSWRGIHFIYR